MFHAKLDMTSFNEADTAKRLQSSGAFEDTLLSREILFNLVNKENQTHRIQDYIKRRQPGTITSQMRNILAGWMKENHPMTLSFSSMLTC
jgi:hypothetical protein